MKRNKYKLLYWHHDSGLDLIIRFGKANKTCKRGSVKDFIKSDNKKLEE